MNWQRLTLLTLWLIIQISMARSNDFSRLHYGTYLGGSLWDEAYAVASDEEGHIYLAGHTQSQDFPTTSRHASREQVHDIEAFIAKIDINTGALLYMRLFPANIEEFAEDIVVDEKGYVYVVGRTDSPDFPTTAGAFDTTHSGTFDFDAFVVKLDPQGELVYSTFLGSEGSDQAMGVAIDAAGNAYVAGSTWATDFPVTSDAYDTTHNGQRDLFLAKLNADGSQLDYATFMGGEGQEQAEEIVLDGNGAVYLTGWTRSEDFPTTAGAYDSQYNGGFEAFAIKLAPQAPNLAPTGMPARFTPNPSPNFRGGALMLPHYITFLGGSGEDRGYGVALDGEGHLAVAGYTLSDDFPTTKGAFDTTYAGGTCQFAPCPDAFVSKLSHDGTNLIYSAYLGGSSWDQANNITSDQEGIVYLSGQTESTDLTTTDGAYDLTLDGERDAFVAQISSNGTTLLYSTYLGGSAEDDSSGITLNQAGQLYIAGKTNSTDFPTTATAYTTTLSADYDAFGVILELPTTVMTPTPTPTATKIAQSQLFLPLVLR